MLYLVHGVYPLIVRCVKYLRQSQQPHVGLARMCQIVHHVIGNFLPCFIVSRHHLQRVSGPAPVLQHLRRRLQEISLHTCIAANRPQRG